MENDDLAKATSYDGSYSVISSSSSHYHYDELITKLQLQAIAAECDRDTSLLQQQQEGPNNQKRILLVDDEPDTCMIYQIVLEDSGFQCISYTDPLKALQALRSSYYDLAILDIKMPVINGFEL